MSMIKTLYRKSGLPAVRKKVSSIKLAIMKLVIKARRRSIPVTACLLGADNCVSAAKYGRMVGDIEYRSFKGPIP